MKQFRSRQREVGHVYAATGYIIGPLNYCQFPSSIQGKATQHETYYGVFLWIEMLPIQDGIEIARCKLPLHSVRQRDVVDVVFDGVDHGLCRVCRPRAKHLLDREGRERDAFEVKTVLSQAVRVARGVQVRGIIGAPDLPV